MADFEIINSNDALESTSRNKINNNFAKAVNKQNTGNDVNDPTSPQDVATKNYVDTLGRDGLINPNFTTPLYVSATSFTVAGDVTSWLRPGRGLVITFQTSGIKRCVATSLSYNSGTNKTTINVIGDSLVNETITSVLLSLSDGENILKWVDTTGKNSGYLKIGEIMIAWGSGDFSGSGVGERTTVVSFPVNFSTTPAVSITVDWTHVSSKHGISQGSLSTSGFTAYSYCDASGAGDYGFHWIAIGRWM